MKFLRNVLAALTALAVFWVVGLVIFFAVVAVVSSTDEVVVEENSILHLKIDKPIVEIEKEDDLLAMLPGFNESQEHIGVVQLKETISKAAEDESIKGIYLDVSYLLSGYGNIEEIRNALLAFRKSHKFIVAYADLYTEGAYYLASVADKVYLNPQGDLEFNGLSANVSFYKGAFEKLQIQPQVFRVGDFKSAVEPFVREDMSEANRLQLSSVLESLNSNLLHNIAKSRLLDVGKLTSISNEMKVGKIQDAIAFRLIDEGLYYDEVLKRFRDRMGIIHEKDLKFISYEDYKNTVSHHEESDNEVAVIVASGDIIRGEGGQDKSIGGRKFAKEIRKARLNDEVKAIVLRINSRGGDFLASDMIWREVKLAAADKPVIASMSDYAASGGYYMAMACDTIVAQPTTITGSIGIYGMLFNAEGFLKDKLGITHDVVKTGKHSDIVTMTRALSDEEKSIIQHRVNQGYDTFTSKAAQGRGMAIEDLLKVASGRVWTGEQALDNGLVDVLGGFDEAIAIAVAKAKIADDYKLRYYPRYEPLIEQLFDGGANVQLQLMKQQLAEMYLYLKEIKNLKSYQGIQARMPYDIALQ